MNGTPLEISAKKFSNLSRKLCKMFFGQYESLEFAIIPNEIAIRFSIGDNFSLGSHAIIR